MNKPILQLGTTKNERKWNNDPDAYEYIEILCNGLLFGYIHQHNCKPKWMIQHLELELPDIGPFDTPEIALEEAQKQLNLFLQQKQSLTPHIKFVALRFTDTGNFITNWTVKDSSRCGVVVTIGVSEEKANEYWNNNCNKQILIKEYEIAAICEAGYNPWDVPFPVQFNGFVY